MFKAYTRLSILVYTANEQAEVKKLSPGQILPPGCRLLPEDKAVAWFLISVSRVRHWNNKGGSGAI